ncbi:MAG: hypothetical protein AAFQ05_13110, partial [Pseudomonadota bacterium]
MLVKVNQIGTLTETLR